MALLSTDFTGEFDAYLRDKHPTTLNARFPILQDRDNAMADEITAEGITQPEAIGRRLLEGLGRLLERYKDGTMTFAATHECLLLMIDILLPFIDPATKEVCYTVMASWKDEAELQAMPTLGEWA